MARWILAPLLLAMAIGQLLDVPGFIAILEIYSIGGTAVAGPLAVAIVVAELAGGIGLLLPGFRRRGATIALATAIVWTVLGVAAFARGLTIPNCGCFGVYLGQSLNWTVLLQDAEFVLLGVLSYRSAHRADVAAPETEPTPAPV